VRMRRRRTSRSSGTLRSRGRRPSELTGRPRVCEEKGLATSPRGWAAIFGRARAGRRALWRRWGGLPGPGRTPRGQLLSKRLSIGHALL